MPGTSGGVPTITIPGLTNALSVNQSYGYDALDRLTQFGAGYPGATTAATGQGILPGETFTFDAIGNRLTRTATPPGGSASTATYAYPNLTSTPGSKRHTLTGITGAQVNAYTYDATGNTKTESAALGTAINPVTGTALAQTYDARNRLKTVQVGTNAADTVSYQVNALGQRVQKMGAGQLTYNSSDVLAPSTGLSPQAVTLAYNARYVYDEQGRLLGEYSPDGKLIAETIWFDDLPVATIRPKGASNQLPLGIAGTGKGTANNAGANSVANSVNVEVFYLHPDHLGTPRVATRSVEAGGATTGPNAINKAVWTWDSDPFGSSIGNSKPNENPQGVTGTASQVQAASFRVNNRFPGQVFDGESGKSYNYFRDYDSSIGRYIESDPIGLRAGLNTFGYVKQTPNRWIDRLGLDYSCGSGWNEPFVPDNPFGFKFLQCCKDHDACYDDCDKRVIRSTCDNTFCSCLRNKCSKTDPAAVLLACERSAALYCSAVRGGGQSAYDDARRKCKPCSPPQGSNPVGTEPIPPTF